MTFLAAPYATFEDDALIAGPGMRRRALVVVALACGAMAAIGLRTSIVRLVPQTAVLFEAAGLPVNVVGLDVARVSARIVADGERRILVVDGDVANAGAQSKGVPPIKVSLRDEAGQQIYTWTAKPQRQDIAPGERIGFSARLASPPQQATSAVVEFEMPSKTAPAASRPAKTPSR